MIGLAGNYDGFLFFARIGSNRMRRLFVNHIVVFRLFKILLVFTHFIMVIWGFSNFYKPSVRDTRIFPIVQDSRITTGLTWIFFCCPESIFMLCTDRLPFIGLAGLRSLFRTIQSLAFWNLSSNPRTACLYESDQ